MMLIGWTCALVLHHQWNNMSGNMKLELLTISDDGRVGGSINGVAFIIVETAEVIEVEGAATVES